MILRTSTKLYAHVDCNCFFVSCEVLRNPALRGKCVVVGGDIIIAASYEARKYGINVGTPLWEAQQMLAGRLIICKPDMGYYRSISDQFMDLLAARSMSVEPFSIDEAFLDITGLPDLSTEGDVTRYAVLLREEIKRRVGIPVSIGVANTRIKAKIFSEIHKPEWEFIGLDHDDEWEVFEKLPVRAIPFVGRSTEVRLGRSVRTVADFKRMSFFALDRLIGKNATNLWLELHGVDAWKLDTGTGHQKSILRSRSFNHFMTDNKHILWRRFLENFENAFSELIAHDYEMHEISVLLRSKELERTRASRAFNQSTANKTQLISICRELLDEVFTPGVFYRTTGVVFSGLIRANPKQLCVFDADNTRHERMLKLEKALKSVNVRYGRGSVILGGRLQ